MVYLLVVGRWLSEWIEKSTVYIVDKVLMRFSIGSMEFSKFLSKYYITWYSAWHISDIRIKKFGECQKPSEISTLFRELYKLNGKSNDITSTFTFHVFPSFFFACWIYFNCQNTVHTKHWNGRSTWLLNFIHHIALYSI